LQNLRFEVENKNVLLVADVSAETSGLAERDISQFVKSSPYSKLELDKTQIKAFISDCLLAKEQAEEEDEPQRLQAVIGQVQDAELSVSISKDKMSVEAEVYTPIGGAPLTLDKVKTACIDGGVRFGLKGQLIEQLLAACERAEPGSVIKGQVAQGQPAEKGKNATLKPLVKLFSETMRKPKELQDGSVDLRDLGNIETVEVGQPILEKVPLTEGKNGRDVLGEKIAPEPGKDTELQASESTLIDEKNPNILKANKAGLVRFNGQLMEVDDVLVYKQLDPKQGHVKFKGSVVIRGDVSPDMKLVATGDVVIGGFVECASIKCGGELSILSGASGRVIDDKNGDGNGQNSKSTHKYSCELISGEQINLAFANQCEITAKHLVNVKKQISHCHVEAESMIVGAGPKPNGQISGGRYYLCKGLSAGIIGTESNVHCDISMNRTYDIFMVKEAELSSWVDTLEERMSALDNEYNRVMDPAVKAQIQRKKDKLQLKLKKYSGYRSALMAKRREYMEAVQINVTNKLFPKVTFYIADRVLLTDSQKGPSQVHVQDFELLIEPL